MHFLFAIGWLDLAVALHVLCRKNPSVSNSMIFFTANRLYISEQERYAKISLLVHAYLYVSPRMQLLLIDHDLLRCQRGVCRL